MEANGEFLHRQTQILWTQFKIYKLHYGCSHQLWSGPVDLKARSSAHKICQLIWILIANYACSSTLSHATTQRTERGFRNIKCMEELQTRNAENSYGKTQHLDLCHTAEIASYWTNHSVQSTTPLLIPWTIVRDMLPCIGMMGLIIRQNT